MASGNRGYEEIKIIWITIILVLSSLFYSIITIDSSFLLKTNNEKLKLSNPKIIASKRRKKKRNQEV